MSHRPLIYSPRPIKTRTLDEMHCRNLEALQLGFRAIVATADDQTFPCGRQLPVADSLRIVGIFDVDPGKRIMAGSGLADNSFQVLLAH